LNLTGLSEDDRFSEALETIMANIKERDEMEDQEKQQAQPAVVALSHTPPVRPWSELWVCAVLIVLVLSLIRIFQLQDKLYEITRLQLQDKLHETTRLDRIFQLEDKLHETIEALCKTRLDRYQLQDKLRE
jgi:hypothetical protein